MTAEGVHCPEAPYQLHLPRSIWIVASLLCTKGLEKASELAKSEFSTSPRKGGPHSWHKLPKTKAVGNLRREVPGAPKGPLVRSEGAGLL